MGGSGEGRRLGGGGAGGGWGGSSGGRESGSGGGLGGGGELGGSGGEGGGGGIIRHLAISTVQSSSQTHRPGGPRPEAASASTQLIMSPRGKKKETTSPGEYLASEDFMKYSYPSLTPRTWQHPST